MTQLNGETIDISSSPTKICGSKSPSKIKAMRNLSNIFIDKDVPLVITPKVDCDLAVKQMLSNEKLGSNPMHSPKEVKVRRRRRRRGKALSSSPKFSVGNHNNNSDNLLNGRSKCSKDLSETTSQNQLPLPPFVKMINRHEELKAAVEKSRHAFSAYKMSTFFCCNTQFIKSFGESLLKAEQSVKSMDEILKTTFAKELTTPIIQPHDAVNTSIDSLPIDIPDLKTVKEDNESLTPPSSEAGNDDKSFIAVEDCSKKKRKMNSATKNNQASSRKQRKCTVKTPLAPKMVLDTSDIAEINQKKAKLDSQENDSDSDSSVEVKDGEFEVRKIQDYIRKQSGFYYRVSWRGYDSDDDTMEPADHLNGCDEALTEFFYQRLKIRQNIFTADQLKAYGLPSDERLKHLLYRAFEKFVLPVSKEVRERGISVVASSKWVCKASTEIQDDILKFLALKDPSLDRYKKLYASIIEQISYKELFPEREKQLADLRVWERSMNIISSDPAPLSVENNVDFELPPLDFVYINEYLPGPNITIPSDPVAGCECKECTSLQKGCCASQMGSYFAYNKYGRLRVSLGTPIYECNKACTCPADCINRVVQYGRKVSLSIFRTSNGRGWGVKTSEAIKKDQFVTEYVGEVISSEDAEQRGMKYDTKGSTYLFDLDYNKGDQNPYTVDAIKYGNVSHFINHSCDPNLVVFNVWVNCLDPDLPKLALFAARDIRKGEEISFDYNSGSTRQISIIDKMDGENTSFPVTPTKHEGEDGTTIIPTTEFIRKTPKNRVLNAGKTECKCGAANCRKFFF